MEFIYKKQDLDQKLKKQQAQELASSIAKKFDGWDGERNTQRNDAEEIQKAVYCKKEITSEQKADWKSHVETSDVYELANTLKAHMWENIHSNPSAMFGVAGKDENAEVTASIQKALLVNSFDDMNVKKPIGEAVNHLVDIGEAVLYIGWKTQQREVRRKVKSLFGLKEIVRQKETVFEGAYVKAINPLNFVFDVNKKDDWLACPKICKSWATYEQIINNKLYQLSAEDKKFLKGSGNNDSEGKSSDDIDEKDDNDKAFKNDQIELLEYWGDIKLDDGTVLNNWHIVVAGRKSVIRFEPNPYVDNTFVYCNLIEDPDTKRGISPIRVALANTEISNEILRSQLDLLKLTLKPCWLVQKGGGLTNKKIQIAPEKAIEYDFDSEHEPIPLSKYFSGTLIGFDFMNFFKSNTESATGIFKNMSGEIAAKNRTATEVQAVMGGAGTRQAMIIDIVNQDLIIPMVKSVADLNANFKFGDENIPSSKNGKTEFVTVTDSVRQAKYKYTYGDKKAMQERKMKFRETLDLLKMLMADPEIRRELNLKEIIRYSFEGVGSDDTDRFILDNNEKLQNIQERIQIENVIRGLQITQNQGVHPDPRMAGNQGVYQPPNVAPPQPQQA